MNKEKQISAEADAKKLVVSFKSDSENESNTSPSSSAVSSSDDSSSSDDEKESSPSQKPATSSVSIEDRKKEAAKSNKENLKKLNGGSEKSKDDNNDIEKMINKKTSELNSEQPESNRDAVKKSHKSEEVKPKTIDEQINSVKTKSAALFDDIDDLPDLSRPKKSSGKTADTPVLDFNASSEQDEKLKASKESKQISKSSNKEDSNKILSNEEEKNDVDVDKEKLTVLPVKESKHRSKSPRDTPTVEKASDATPVAIPAVEIFGQLEDKNLAVPVVKVSKHRSKSPREAPPVEVSDDFVIPVNDVVKQPDDQNLAVPEGKVAKRRSKSPREAQVEDASESIVENKLPSKKKSESVSPVPDSLIADSDTSKRDSATNESNSEPKKKSRSQSLKSPVDDNNDAVTAKTAEEDLKLEKRSKKTELENSEIPEKSWEISDDSLLKPSKKKKKKPVDESAEADEEKAAAQAEDVTNAEESNLDLKVSKSSKKKSSKDKTTDEQVLNLENVADGVEKETVSSKIDGESATGTKMITDVDEPPKTKKKSRKSIDDSPASISDTPTVSKELKEDDLKADEEVSAVTEKPKKKKSSKSAVEETIQTSQAESLEVNDSVKLKTEISGIDKNFANIESDEKSLKAAEAIPGERLLSETCSEKTSKDENVVKIVAESSDNVTDIAPQILTKNLEEAIQEKCDIVVLNEIEELPSAEFSMTIVKPMSELDLLLEEARLMTSGRTREPEAIRTEANALPAEVEVDSSSNIQKPKVASDLEFSLNNEESDLSSRRKSMDDFIKKILAEARDENKALKASKEMVTDSSKLENKFDETKFTLPTEGVDDVRGARKTEKSSGLSRNDEKYMDDDDDDLDFSKLRSNKRQPKKVLEDMDLDDSASPPSERGAGRPQYSNRYRSREDADYLDSDETRTPAAGAGRSGLRGARIDTDDADDAPGESFIAKFRREREENQLPEDMFKPKRGDDTATVVRDKTRTIRAMVEQQASCAKNFNLTKRFLDEAEGEMRDVRQLSLDWQARIDALETALDIEYRTYESDLQTATDRLSQQHKPDDRALREELARQQAERLRRMGGRQEESLLEGILSPFTRRRSGSVTSNYGASSFMSEASSGGGGDTGTDRIGAYSTGRSYLDAGSEEGRWNFDTSRVGREFDLASTLDRARREGSLTRRDRYSIDMNTSSTGLGRDDDRYLASPSRAGSARPVVDMSANPSRSDAVMKIRAKYASLDETGDGYVTPTRLRSTPRDSAYGSLSSDYSLMDASKSHGSRREVYSPSPFADYSSSLYTPGRYSSVSSGNFGGSSSYLSERDPVSTRLPTSSYESGSSLNYRSVSAGEPTAVDYQNKFLSRVRGSAALGSESRSTLEEKPFKSRFLKSSAIV